jgi:hypothetical protein
MTIDERRGTPLTYLAVACTATLALLALASCATPTASGDSPDGSPVSSGPLPPGGGQSGDPSAPNVVSTEPAVDLHPQRWSTARPVHGRPEVLVRGTLSGGPPCAVLGRVDVDETTERVTITVWVGRRPGAACDGPQAETAFPYLTRVRLAHPVAGRVVHDGAS